MATRYGLRNVDPPHDWWPGCPVFDSALAAATWAGRHGVPYNYWPDALPVEPAS